jgi:hypothetical protein
MWNGADRKNWDIYVKLVGDVESVRLTSEPAVDASPSNVKTPTGDGRSSR